MTPTIQTPDDASLADVDIGAGARPVALLLHGMGGDHTEMLPLAERFAASRRVIVPDLPGHGANHTASDRVDTVALADSVVALVEELELTELLLIGDSLGGPVAVMIAAGRPELVGRLVLLDPGMAMPDTDGLRGFYDSLEADGYAATLRSALQPMLFRESDGATVVEGVLGRMTRLPPELFRRLGHGVLAFDSTHMLPRVTVPSLLIAPETPLAALETARALAPDWCIGRVVGTGHYGQLVTPEQVSTMIDAFLAVPDGQVSANRRKAVATARSREPIDPSGSVP